MEIKDTVEYESLPYQDGTAAVGPTVDKERNLWIALGIAAGVLAIVLVASLLVGAASALSGDDQADKIATEETATVETESTSSDSDSGVIVYNEGSKNVVAISNKSVEAYGLSEQEVYEALSAYYQQAASFDRQVASCASNFNDNYAVSCWNVRNGKAQVAYALRNTIASADSSLEGLSIDFWSSNYEAWQQLCEAYDCLYMRINVICKAWDISLSYSEPGNHVDEIIAPIVAQRGANGNDQYYTRFKQLFPTIKIVEP